MKELVFVNNNEPVTDSLTVAEAFGKEHARVMRDIRDLECSEEFRVGNFAESSYMNKQKREMPMYYISQGGFSFLVMGYTGKRAAEFKERYINEFRRMEKQLQEPRVLTEKEQLRASMQLSLETSEEIGEIKQEVNTLKNRFDNELTLKHAQAQSLQHAIKKRVERLFADGVMGVLESKKQMYSRIHSQLRRAFQTPTYREVKRVDYDEAMQWVNAWRPL
ncbi:Rha family transcriptional regulator [Halobacillus salinus]|uniref:Rha family transcriptional regulator n=1 Tax=Halobacillus salinus TaxID=192814 RepID=UPI0020CA832B|nr:Rha family transcriptional regulator [Halobacillus salinus]